MRRPLLASALILLVASCASSQDRVQAHHAQTIDQLASEWGPPDFTYQNADGQKFLVYTRPPSDTALNTGTGAAHAANYVCRIIFETDRSGIITSSHVDGDVGGCSGLLIGKS